LSNAVVEFFILYCLFDINFWFNVFTAGDFLLKRLEWGVSSELNDLLGSDCLNRHIKEKGVDNGCADVIQRTSFGCLIIKNGTIVALS